MLPAPWPFSTKASNHLQCCLQSDDCNLVCMETGFQNHHWRFCWWRDLFGSLSSACREESTAPRPSVSTGQSSYGRMAIGQLVKLRNDKNTGNPSKFGHMILLMAEILHLLRCKKPCKQWDILPINWCRISSINSTTATVEWLHFATCSLFNIELPIQKIYVVLWTNP